MWHPNRKEAVIHRSQSRIGRSTSSIIILFCLALVIAVLASCGSTTVGQTGSKTQTPLGTSSARSTPIPTPTPTPTPTPPPPPQATQAPPTGAPPPILDLQPASMSFIGHRDCPGNGVFVCQARVISDSANQSALNWSTFTNVPGNIVFSPSSGTLAPGQSVLVNITIPLNACQSGLFFFRGPANTHTITWAC